VAGLPGAVAVTGHLLEADGLLVAGQHGVVVACVSVDDTELVVDGGEVGYRVGGQ
jgi:hypothetical protein